MAPRKRPSIFALLTGERATEYAECFQAKGTSLRRKVHSVTARGGDGPGRHHRARGVDRPITYREEDQSPAHDQEKTADEHGAIGDDRWSKTGTDEQPRQTRQERPARRGRGPDRLTPTHHGRSLRRRNRPGKQWVKRGRGQRATESAGETDTPEHARHHEPTGVGRQREDGKAQRWQRGPRNEEGAPPEPIGERPNGQEQDRRPEAGRRKDPANQQRPQPEIVQVEREEDQQETNGQRAQEAGQLSRHW